MSFVLVVVSEAAARVDVFVAKDGMDGQRGGMEKKSTRKSMGVYRTGWLDLPVTNRATRGREKKLQRQVWTSTPFRESQSG